MNEREVYGQDITEASRIAPDTPMHCEDLFLISPGWLVSCKQMVMSDKKIMYIIMYIIFYS